MAVLSIQASKGLADLMESQKESVRLRACQTVMNYNMKIFDVQALEERVAEIEENLFMAGIRRRD